ncbi:hypothetical protein MKW92_033480 [Papaver armeniacum]|nr:hypothetical protein MKW92_033480 [Papaver armeniacum]
MSMGEIEEFQNKHKVDLDSCNEDSIVIKSGFGSVIVVDNLPVVAADKYDKLVQVIKKIFGITEENCLWMPVDPETKISLSYCFIEYKTPKEAELAIQMTNKKRLDSSHILSAIRDYKPQDRRCPDNVGLIISTNSFDDFDRFMKLSADEWAFLEIKPYTPWENLQQWLTDVKARDQFVIRAGNDTEIFWNDPRQSGLDLVYHRTSWSDSFVQWSSYGTYLATLNGQGVDVWGGAATFGRISSCAHPQVELIDFSPCRMGYSCRISCNYTPGEKYLITYSSHEPSKPDYIFKTHRVVLNIFDMKTGKIMRSFEGSANEFAVGGVSRFSWPFFRWGGGKDDKYFARIGKNVISVYETNNFTLIDKKSLRVKNVLDFSWSPADPIIALFVPDLDRCNQPTRQKNLFGVIDCKMYWQGNGEYLVVNYTKTRKIKERDIPIEVLELENKNDKIIAFAWEPKGNRFAVINGDSPRVNVSFYPMRTATKTGWVSNLTTLQGKNASIVAGLNGQLEFYDVDELETMKIAKHFISWRQTSNGIPLEDMLLLDIFNILENKMVLCFVATFVTSVHEMENGFNIWSLTGKLLYKISKNQFHQFSWRPRPPSFLTAGKEEEISKNLDIYNKKYETEDQDAAAQLHGKDRQNREMMQQE